MAAKSKLSLKEAQSEFTDFLSKINPQDIAPFLQWVGYSFSTKRDDLKPKFIRDASEKIMEIAEHLRQRIPFNGTLESETVLWPKAGFDSDCNEINTVHVDCFLFDDEAVDDLVSQGSLSRNYCVSCGSKNTKELTFISHSLAPSQLEFIFTELVPLKTVKQGFNVVDIGSRLGSVLYAAHLYGCGNASVTGIELNEDLCKLQESIISDFNLQNIDVICSDVRSQPDIIAKADLIIMNNVFSFFLSLEEQASCWQFLYDKIKPGCIIIHNPDISDIVAHLDLHFTLSQWLDKVPIATQCAKFAGEDETLFEDCANLAMYRVKERE